MIHDIPSKNALYKAVVPPLECNNLSEAIYYLKVRILGGSTITIHYYRSIFFYGWYFLTWRLHLRTILNDRWAIKVNIERGEYISSVIEILAQAPVSRWQFIINVYFLIFISKAHSIHIYVTIICFTWSYTDVTKVCYGKKLELFKNLTRFALCFHFY